MSDEGWTVEAALAKLREALGEKGMSVDDMFAAFDADSDGTINGPELHFGIKAHLPDLPHTVARDHGTGTGCITIDTIRPRHKH